MAKNATIDISQEGSMPGGPMDDNNAAELPGASENRLCPLCQSPIRLFFINFHEKFLMCENLTCEFPFGYEELQFVKTADGSIIDEEGVSLRSRTHDFLSTTSSKDKSDNERSNQSLESESSQFNQPYVPKTTRRKKQTDEERMKRNVSDIREMNEELEHLKEEVKERKQVVDNIQIIKNEKWINNLKNLQKISGVQLLKPEEIGLLKMKQEPHLGLGELKIDIRSVSDGSPIQIEIHNTSAVKEDITPAPDKPTGKDPLPV